MRVLHLDSVLLKTDTEMVEMIEMIDRMEPLKETIILFIENLIEKEILSSFLPHFQTIEGTCIQLAPDNSIHWTMNSAENQNDSIAYMLDDFWQKLPKTGSLVLAWQGVFLKGSTQKKHPSFQWLALGLSEQLHASYQLVVSKEVGNDLNTPSFSKEYSYDGLLSYIAIIPSGIAKDLVIQAKKHAHSFEVIALGKKNSSIKIGKKSIPDVANRPLIMKETGTYHKLVIHSYQLHRTPKKVIDMMHLIESCDMSAMIQSTSVDGMVVLIQKTEETSQKLTDLVIELEKSVQFDEISIRPVQTFLTIAFSKEIKGSYWVSKVWEVVCKEGICAEVLGSIYSRMSITCSVESKEYPHLKSILYKEVMAGSLPKTTKNNQIA